MWSYKCYVTRERPNLWAYWYAQNPGLRGAHDATFRILEQRDVWQRPNFKILKKRGGLGEVLFKANKVQWRVFGFFGPNDKEFIVLGCGYHKDRVYKPRDIIKTCHAHMLEVKDDPKNAKPCRRPQ